MIFKILFLSFYLSHLAQSAVIDTTVTIPEGKLNGNTFQTRSGKQGVSFLGIPYSKPAMRFKVAEPPLKWTAVRDASKFGPICTQFIKSSGKTVGSEDCLFINVYTPLIPKNSIIKPAANGKALPVLLFIHGGSFLAQSGNGYSPKYLLENEDVLLVTFNFRLGVFGFMNTGDKESIPNLGMRDQVLALKWVKERISYFGGDPNKITLIGSSAGAASVSYHLLSPMSAGLFQAAIAESGTSLAPWALVRHPEKVVSKLAAHVGCTSKISSEVVSCLKTKDAKILAENQQKLLGWTQDPSVPFAPSVETVTLAGETKFLPDYPSELFKAGKFNKVPLLTGVNSLEGYGIGIASLLNNSKALEQVDQSWEGIAPLAFAFSDTAPDPRQVSAKVREHYFGKKNISLGTGEQLANAMSDRHFFEPIKTTAVLYGKSNPVYVYYFTRELGSSVLGALSPDTFGLKGVEHVNELQTIFPLNTVPEIKEGSKNLDFSRKMVKLWVSFATDLKPTKTWGHGAIWQPIVELTKDLTSNWYNIDTDTKLIPEPFSARVQFWNSLQLDQVSKSSPGSNTPQPSTNKKPTQAPPTIPAGASSTTTTTKKPGFFSKLIGK